MGDLQFTHKTEDQLWDLMKKGSRAALGLLYDRHVKNLYNYGRKICEDADVVQDAIHDLFVDLWRYRKTLATVTSVRYYLYRSLRRKINRSENSRSLKAIGPLDWDDIGSLMLPPSEHVLIDEEITDERTRRLKKYLNSLSPRQYEAIVLHFYDDFSYEEIGSLMDVNTQSSRNLVQRGLLQLRQYAQLLI